MYCYLACGAVPSCKGIATRTIATLIACTATGLRHEILHLKTAGSIRVRTVMYRHPKGVDHLRLKYCVTIGWEELGAKYYYLLPCNLFEAYPVNVSGA